MNVIAFTDIGLVREKNQDTYFLSEDLNFPLFIIADGMGGHKSGEIASNDAVEIIKNIFSQEKSELINNENIIDIIEKSFHYANSNIYKKSLEVTTYRGMGTTVSLAYIFEDNIIIGHAGDSRIYKIEGNNMVQITEDHSLVNELIKSGKITKEEAKTHPQKNIITRAVGTSIDIDIDIKCIKYKEKDKLLLCTDGLFNMIDEDEIEKIIKESSSMSIAAEKLITTANENGGLDNITIILIEF